MLPQCAVCFAATIDAGEGQGGFDVDETAGAPVTPAPAPHIDSREFPAHGPAATRQMKPLTVASCKRPIAEPKPMQSVVSHAAARSAERTMFTNVDRQPISAIMQVCAS